MWAKCNIGATSETDYGNYFMWGSTTPNTVNECNWTNAPFNNGSSDFNPGYFNDHKSEWLDSKNNLKPEYDAASHIMGGDWRMPTKEEFQELLNGTTNEWITNYKGTGVNGRKFTSKTDMNKYIFIPAADICEDGSVNGVGNYGDVWSSSLSDPSNAWVLSFRSSSCYMDSELPRCSGRSVRGVRK